MPDIMATHQCVPRLLDKPAEERGQRLDVAIPTLTPFLLGLLPRSDDERCARATGTERARGFALTRVVVISPDGVPADPTPSR